MDKLSAEQRHANMVAEDLTEYNNEKQHGIRLLKEFFNHTRNNNPQGNLLTF